MERAHYARLKLELSQHLTPQQWKTMAKLLLIPEGDQHKFTSACDLFQWMENNNGDHNPHKHVYLSPCQLDTLQELLTPCWCC